MKTFKVRFSALLLLYIFIGNFALGQQNYGLSFNSFNVPQEKRTSLILDSEKPLCFDDNMDIAFDMHFISNRSTYFGYVFRMINSSGQNIDLIYNQKDQVFNTVVGASLSSINFKVPPQALYNEWTNIRFHLQGEKLQCFINGRLDKETIIGFKDRCFQIIFGACHLTNFSTTDVPPMVIRNIGISNKGKLRYYWPLRDDDPNPLNDSIHHLSAEVLNPKWSGELHRTWQQQLSVVVKGNASYAFDPEKEIVYVVAEDSVYAVHAGEEPIPDFSMPSRNYHLFQGNQSLFNSVDKRLYNLYIDIKGLGAYNRETSMWSNHYDTVANTEYGHTSRIFIPQENALYIFGGYGQLRYKNKVQRINFKDQSWHEIQPKGDYFTPRYMAGAGRFGDSIYLFGGYGSHDGDQRLNPRHYYDLMLYNIKTRRFKKVYSLAVPRDPFVLAGSMVIDSVHHSFYALTYDENKYNTKLQLVEGSLTKPTYKLLGNAIPYSFQDIVSDADLFYCSKSKKLLAVTQLSELGKSTAIKVFSIAFPPDAIIESSDLTSLSWWYKDGLYYVLGGVLILSLAVICFYLIRKKNKSSVRGKIVSTPVWPDKDEEIASSLSGVKINIGDDAKATQETPAFYSGQGALDVTEIRLMAPPAFLEERLTGLRIYLFGTFEMFNEEGEEMSQQFSPLLKELFLMVLLFTVKDGKGISTERINDIFWGNKTGKNAKNNLSVNMVRLKSILSKAGNIFIKKEGSRWICDYTSPDVHIDLIAFLKVKADREQDCIAQVRHMLYFISRGAFLKQTEYGWLDEIKADINNKTIDELLEDSKMLDPVKDVEYIIEIANNIFHIDPLNEDALQLKCKSLNRIGRHSLAKNTYERFAKEYQKIYGEPFYMGFNDFVK